MSKLSLVCCYLWTWDNVTTVVAECDVEDFVRVSRQSLDLGVGHSVSQSDVFGFPIHTGIVAGLHLKVFPEQMPPEKIVLGANVPHSRNKNQKRKRKPRPLAMLWKSEYLIYLYLHVNPQFSTSSALTNLKTMAKIGSGSRCQSE